MGGHRARLGPVPLGTRAPVHGAPPPAGQHLARVRHRRGAGLIGLGTGSTAGGGILGPAGHFRGRVTVDPTFSAVARRVWKGCAVQDKALVLCFACALAPSPSAPAQRLRRPFGLRTAMLEKATGGGNTQRFRLLVAPGPRPAGRQPAALRGLRGRRRAGSRGSCAPRLTHLPVRAQAGPPAIQLPRGRLGQGRRAALTIGLLQRGLLPSAQPASAPAAALVGVGPRPPRQPRRRCDHTTAPSPVVGRPAAQEPEGCTDRGVPGRSRATAAAGGAPGRGRRPARGARGCRGAGAAGGAVREGGARGASGVSQPRSARSCVRHARTERRTGHSEGVGGQEYSYRQRSGGPRGGARSRKGVTFGGEESSGGRGGARHALPSPPRVLLVHRRLGPLPLAAAGAAAGGAALLLERCHHHRCAPAGRPPLLLPRGALAAGLVHCGWSAGSVGGWAGRWVGGEPRLHRLRARRAYQGRPLLRGPDALQQPHSPPRDSRCRSSSFSLPSTCCSTAPSSARRLPLRRPCDARRRGGGGGAGARAEGRLR
jgi:hypothetical protein